MKVSFHITAPRRIHHGRYESQAFILSFARRIYRVIMADLEAVFSYIVRQTFYRKQVFSWKQVMLK